MCNTFFPSTESNPERTHSVRPVPRMICFGWGWDGELSEGGWMLFDLRNRILHPLLSNQKEGRFPMVRSGSTKADTILTLLSPSHHPNPIASRQTLVLNHVI